MGIALLNLWGFPRLRPGKPACTPKVSILIPMRDEEENAEACLASALAQDYPAFEVLVYEEGSQDRTKLVLSQFHDPRLRVIFGDGPPPGWLGKPWACARLAQAATGEILLFLDADVRLKEEAVAAVVAALAQENLDFLSLLPHQEVRTLGEALHVPLIPWSLNSFFPLFLPKLRRVAVGQFLLIRRPEYERMGGHGAVRAEVLEDQALAERAVKAGLRTKLLFAGGLARCRMYRGFWAANRGLAKGLFPLFKRRILPFAFVWTWLLYVAWQPLVMLLLGAFGHVPAALRVPAAWALGGAWALWSLTTVRFRLPPWLPLAYPLVHLVAWFTAIRSALWHLLGRGTWKGRSIYVKGEQ
ncbi:MAG: glycosyltransferase [Candidatus Bipolaricaulaceae bacterium]